MNHYPRHVGDYLKKTIGLSMLEDGAYSRALDWYYGHERPLPKKPAIYGELRCLTKAERNAVDAVLLKYFLETEIGYTHARCDAEILAYKAKSGKAAQSAIKRWRDAAKAVDNYPKNGANAYADAMPAHSVGNANQNQNHINHSETPVDNFNGLPQRPNGKGEKDSPKGNVKSFGAWARSEEGTIAYGKALGVEAKRGESMEEYRARLSRHTEERKRL